MSLLLHKGNLWFHVERSNNVKEKYHFHPELFVWAKTIIGDRYRGIPKLTRTGWSTVLKFISRVASDDISDDMLSVQLDELMKYIDKKKIENTDFNHNMYCTSVKNQVDAFLDTEKAIILHQIQDMEDLKTLQQVNETVFKNYPLEMSKLMREPSPFNKYQAHDDYAWRKLYISKQKDEAEKMRQEEQAYVR